MPKLTKKQAAFVAEYVKDKNATQAAIRAGYSKKSAFNIGCENVKKPYIAEAIEKRLEKVSERALIDAERVLNGLLKEAEYSGEGASHSARVSAWEKLGKYLGMFTEKSIVTLEKSPAEMTDEELEAALRARGLL